MTKKTFTAACVQMNTTNDIAKNISRANKLIRQAAGENAEFVALPETAFFIGANQEQSKQNAETMAASQAVKAMAALAKELKLWILFGTSIKAVAGKLINRSVLVNPSGKVASFYDKINLFDVDVPGGEVYHESGIFQAGKKIVTANLPWGKLGMTICYDLRFPQLFRKLAQRQAGIITVPAAFTKVTGKDHWHVLLRARAIETSSFIIAPAQCGTHANHRQTYGHSLIIDPWGKILAEASGARPGVITAKIDLHKVAEIRDKLPGWKVNKV